MDAIEAWGGRLPGGQHQRRPEPDVHVCQNAMPLPMRADSSFRFRARRWFAVGLLLLASCAVDGVNKQADRGLDEFPLSAAPMQTPPISAKTRAAFARLGAGVNFGNMLDAPHEGDWGSRVQDGYPSMVRQAGFRHVRLPVRWSAHASRDASAQIDPEFMARVDDVVDRLLAEGLTVVLDMHHYRQLDGDRLDTGEMAVEHRDVKLRFLSMWRQIAEHFAGRSEQLWFELYNEPHGEQTAASWNDLASRALRVVRASNPERVVVIGSAQWNSARALDDLVLPPDANLVVTIHDYEPFPFTHQGATWTDPASAHPSGVRCCNAQQRQQLIEPLAVGARWAERRGVPLWLGEFGSYGGPPTHPNDIASRAEYTRLVREAAQLRGIAWAYWELDAGFGVYDPKTQQWREPLRRALFGP